MRRGQVWGKETRWQGKGQAGVGNIVGTTKPTWENNKNLCVGKGARLGGVGQERGR